MSELAKKLLSSNAKVDLLELFHTNPELTATMDTMARKIGRKTEEIQTDAMDLMDIGLLRRKRRGASTVIFLDKARERQIQEEIATHLKALKITDLERDRDSENRASVA